MTIRFTSCLVLLGVLFSVGCAQKFAVIGKVVMPEDTKGPALVFSDVKGKMSASAKYEPRPYPEGFKKFSNDEKRKWVTDWSKTDEGKAHRARAKKAYENRKQYEFAINDDGTFRIEGVELGRHSLAISIMKGDEQIAVGGQAVTVKGPGPELSVEDISLKRLAYVPVGGPAPAFETKTVDGKTVKLSDFRGKYLLIDFWATWCPPCVAETPNLKATFEKYRSNPKFAMIGLSVDKDAAKPKAYAQKNGLEWVNGHLGLKNPVGKSYGVRGIPSIWLIGPDGKVVAKGLRGDAIPAAIEKHLNAKAAG